MADNNSNLASLAVTPSSSSRSSSPKTSYRVTRTTYLDDIPSKFEKEEDIFSADFFSQHDPHPIIFYLAFNFGTTVENYLSAYLCLTSKDVTTTIACFKISAYNDKGILVKCGKSGRFKMTDEEGEYGAPRLLKKKSLLASAFWRIIFEFEYEAVSTEITKVAPSSADTRLHKDFRQLLDSGKDSDVVFLVKDEKIKAHKIILTARCEYFESMFSSGMAESVSKEIVVTDVDPTVFKQLLNFVYADVPPAWSEDLTWMTMMELLTTADKYGVGDLKKYCELTLCSRLNADNVIEALLLAESHDCPALMATAMSVFGSYVDVLKQRKRLEELKKSPSLLLKLLERYCLG